MIKELKREEQKGRYKVRIAFSGAGGTGKGTLARYVTKHINREKGFNFTLIESRNEPITELLCPDSENYKDMPPAIYDVKQFAILGGQIAQEEAAGDDFISERSIFDYLAYFSKDIDELMKLSKDEMSRRLLYVDTYREMVARAAERRPYDIIFMTPADFIPDDSEENIWKERDEAERAETERKIARILELVVCHESTSVVCLTGSFSEKTERAMEEIRKVSKEKESPRKRRDKRSVINGLKSFFAEEES